MFCIRKSYPNRQSNTEYGNWDGRQLITRKRGNSSNLLDFKEVYSLHGFYTNDAHINLYCTNWGTKKFCKINLN